MSSHELPSDVGDTDLDDTGLDETPLKETPLEDDRRRAEDHRGRRVDELLEQWELRRLAGEDVSLEQLCLDSPECLGDLQIAVGCLQRLDRIGGTGRDSQPDRSIPDRIGEYQIIEEIGRGGASIVYRATQQSLGRDVALKLLRAGDRPHIVLARFEREVLALKRLQHPGIAAVIDAGVIRPETVAVPYIIIEYVPGVSLAEYVDRHELDLTTRLRLFIDVCQAVVAAHQQGIIHRDLKPSNILVTADGQSKVCDFGLAVIQSDDAETLEPITRSFEILGTLQYMSPEHVRRDGPPVETRSDLYSLGLILFELLTDERPYNTSGLGVVPAASLICDKDAPSVRQIRPQLPRDLETITRKSLEKEPQARYQTVAAFVADIERFLRHEPVLARPVGAMGQALRWGQRNPGIAVAAGIAFLAMLIGTTASSFYAWRANIHATKADERLSQLQIERQRVEAQRRSVDAARLMAQRTSFNATLGRIHSFSISDPQLASELLHDEERCPRDLRGFAWNYLNGQNATLLHVLQGPSEGNGVMRISRNGGRFVSAGNDARIRFWDTRSSDMLATVYGLSGSEPFAVSALGKLVVSPGRDGSLIMLSEAGSNPFLHLDSATGIPTHACFLSESTIAIGTDSGTVEIWDFMQPRRIAELQVGQQAIRHFDATDGDRLLAMARSGEVAAWDTETWEPLFTSSLPGTRSSRSIASRSGWIASCTQDRILVHHESGELQRTITATSPVLRLQADHRGHAIVAGQRRRVEVYDPRSGELIRLFRHPESDIADITVGGDPQNQKLAISDHDGAIALYRLATEACRIADVKAALTTIEYSPDGNWLAAGDSVGVLRLLDAATLSERSQLNLSHRCPDLAWHPDSKSLTAAILRPGNNPTKSTSLLPGLFVVSCPAAAGADGSIAPHIEGHPSLPQLQIAHEWPPFRQVSRVSCSPDGRYVAAAARRELVLVLDATTGETIIEIPCADAGSLAIDFSPDSSLLAVGDADAALTLWQIPSGTNKAATHVSRGSARVCRFAADGASLYSAGGHYGEVHRWSVPDLKSIAVFRGPRDVVNDMAVTPDGQTLALASRDHVVTLMDARTGDMQLALPHDGPVTSVSFSPDGQSLATVTRSSVPLRVWDARPR